MKQLLRLISGGIMLFGVGCVTAPMYPDLPVEMRSKDDNISTQTAVYLSEASYRLGCVEAHKKLGKVKGSNKYCTKKAKQNVKTNVIQILNQ